MLIARAEQDQGAKTLMLNIIKTYIKSGYVLVIQEAFVHQKSDGTRFWSLQPANYDWISIGHESYICFNFSTVYKREENKQWYQQLTYFHKRLHIDCCFLHSQIKIEYNYKIWTTLIIWFGFFFYYYSRNYWSHRSIKVLNVIGNLYTLPQKEKKKDLSTFFPPSNF